MSKQLPKPQVKICGITNLEDAQICINLGANYLGLIFVPNTKRHLEITKLEKLAIQIKAEIKANSLAAKLVLVTKLQYLEELKTLLQLFDIVQIHDTYEPKVVSKIRNLGLEVWQLFNFENPNITDSNISQFVVDKPKNDNISQEKYLQILQNTNFPNNFVLAGEISTQNLEQFLVFSPQIIDVCSSVESSFGHKSQTKLTQLFQKININTGK